MHQPGLFDAHPSDRTITERFEAWLAARPEMLPAFVRVARQLRQAGHDRYSADGIFHILRWERIAEGKDADGWTVNNVFSSRMARLVMERHKDLEGFFETRRLKSS